MHAKVTKKNDKAKENAEKLMARDYSLLLGLKTGETFYL